MNSFKKLSSLLFIFVATLHAERIVSPTIINRSQANNAAFKIAGLSEKTRLFNSRNYVNVDGALAYERSFRSHQLAELLFGDDLINCNSILIQGSHVEDRDAKAWLADYFYLPTDFNASFSIKPRIQNVLLNLDFYASLDDVMEGLYFRVHGPLTWSRWDLNYNELCDHEFTNSSRVGYYTWDGLENDQLLKTFADFASGKSSLNTSGYPHSLLSDIGVSFQGLHYAKMERCARSRLGFAGLHFELGYNFLHAEDYHLGLNVQVIAPTGNRRDAEFAFDPTLGNGNHWQVGGGLTAHYLFYKSEDEESHAGIYLDVNLTHVNNGRERRTFDLVGRPNSRYMLAQKMGQPVNYLLAELDPNVVTGGGLPSAQFKGVLAPVANLTTVDVHVRASIEADIAAMLNYTSNNWGFDVGYNFWTKSCEKLKLPKRPTSKCCPSLCTMQADMWALKGDAQLFGYADEMAGDLPQGAPIPLSATQCGATIHKGTNVGFEGDDCDISPRLGNCGVDNPHLADVRGPNSGTNDFLTYDPSLTNEEYRIKTSFQPKFINCCDINFQRTRGLSHKVFGNLNYTWDKEGWNPYVGLGGSAEFARHSSDDKCQSQAPDCDTDCTTECETPCKPSKCIDSAVSQWAVWIKGGINFE